MNDIEIVIFNDKSWVRLTEYQKLKEENETLKKQVSYLEDNLRVARKDREELRDAVANSLVDFIAYKSHTSLRLLADKEVQEENEQFKQQIEKMKCCNNCKHSYHDRYHTLQCLCNCINFDKWELAE